MSAITVVEFERPTLPSQTYLSELEDGSGDSGPPYTIHGVALGDNDVTKGKSGIKKKWPAQELKKAAETLQGQSLVVNHDNTAEGVVGRVTKAGYKGDTGVVYEADLYDEELAEKVQNGLLEVSVRGLHADVDSLEEDEETGAIEVKDIEFKNLSIVPTGAAPSNTLEMGEHTELSQAELSLFTEELAADLEPGDWVQWGDKHGIIMTPTDGEEEVEVDIYEEHDERWRPIEETEMVTLNSLESWDVDEEDEIGPAPEKDKEENAPLVKEGMKFYSTVNDTTVVVDRVEGNQVHVSTTDGDSSWKETVDMIYEKLANGEWDHAGHMDAMNADPMEFSEGQMVQWQANSNMFGKIVHIADDEGKIMVEIMQEGDDGMETTNQTVTAGFSDLIPMKMAENATTTKNVPTEDSEPSHDGMSNDKLIKMLMKMLREEDLSHVEGEEILLDSIEQILRSRADEERYVERNPEDFDELAPDASYSRGDWVRWDTRNSTEIGKVIGSYTEGDDIPDIRGSRGLSPEGDDVLYTLRMYKERDGAFHPIEGKPIGHYEDSVRSSEEPSDVSDSAVELEQLGRSNVDTYDDFEKDDWVEWYPSETSSRHGKVLDVDEGDDQLEIQVWTQNSDGEWQESEDVVRKDIEGVGPWGNFPRKQEDFADAFPEGEDPRKKPADNEYSDEEENADSAQLLSNQTEKALKNKVEEHNDEHGDDEGKRVTYRMLKNVYNRGAGAYNDSHREGMSQQQWAMARVNAFLYLVRNGNPENDAYKQDNDLLPEEHSKYSENPPDSDEEENAAVLAKSYDDYPEAAAENAQMALDAKEETDNPNDCGTDVGWKRARQLANGEGITREQLGKMSSFNRHRQNSEQGEEGREDCGWMMWKAWGGDEGVDWAQSKLDSLEEEAGISELVDYDMHTPNWDGTTERDWSRPDMEDFDTDDLSEIADHFLISMSGFPPENYGDLKLPVVEPNGDLNINAMAAVKGGRGAGAVDGLSSDMEDKIIDWVNETANDPDLFDRDWGKSESENMMDVPENHRFESKSDAMDFIEDMDGIDGVHEMEFDGETMYVPGETHEDYTDAMESNSYDSGGMEEDDEEEMQNNGNPASREIRVGGVRVLPGDDLRDGSIGASESDSMTKYKVTIMNDEIEEKLSELSEPVAVEAEELQGLQDKADRFEELSENIEALRERTEILDEVDRDSVEELRDSDDPVVVESARYEELESEAEQVKGVYAASLAEQMPGFEAEELADAHDLDTLREKHEDVVGELEDELSATSEEASPRSQDPSEEELAEAAHEHSEEEELADKAAQKQEEILDKIKSGRL